MVKSMFKPCDKYADKLPCVMNGKCYGGATLVGRAEKVRHLTDIAECPHVEAVREWWRKEHGRRGQRG